MRSYAVLILFVLVLTQSANLAQGMQYPYVSYRAKTVAGDLQVVLPALGKWHLQLGDKIIFHDDSVAMAVLKHITQKIAPFDEVVILHRCNGTYCNGGTFWFLGLKQDGSYRLSTGVGKCFAHEPIVITGQNYLKVTVKGGYGNNRMEREPYLPRGTWLYKNGQVTKIKTRKK